MWRSLSTKLLLAVFAAVILPFGGFAFYLQDQIAGRMTTELVRKSLLGLSEDLAGDVEHALDEVRGDLSLWAAEPAADWVFSIDPAEGQNWNASHAIDLARWYEGLPDGFESPLQDGAAFPRELTESLDRYVTTKPEFDLLLLVDAAGYLVCCSTIDRDGVPLPEDVIYDLFARSFAEEPWFETAITGGFALQDHHVSNFLHPEGPPAREDQLATDFGVGLATPVRDKANGSINGVLYALVNWSTFQDLVDQRVVKEAFRGLVSGDEQPSPYAWIWGRDADTILAHQYRKFYRMKVSGELGLRAMRDDARGAEFGMYRDYVFMGKKKTAAFWHTVGAGEGGFGWVVGVGIDYDDIYKASAEQRKLLLRGTFVVLLLVLLWMSIIARRTTEPIARLERHTRAVAGGDLSARVVLKRSDELGQLADAMNTMTRDLERNRAALIKAEKDAAWREMARQVAHDLKNPLTPIQLSLDLVERSRAEGSDQAEAILERTLDLMRRQVKSLRATATEFYEFTGGAPPEPQDLELGTSVQRVLELHQAWAERDGIEVATELGAAPVRADANKLERVLTNLVTNAFQAMPEGGCLEVFVGAERGRSIVRITDNGAGLSQAAMERLFEPYFTTKSQGTGLGLAVSARFVEEMGGSLALEPRTDGTTGATATLELPELGRTQEPGPEGSRA